MNLAPLHDDMNDDLARPTVAIEDDAIVLDGFREPDARVQEAVRAADDPEGMVHRILELGARCVTDTSTLLQTQAVAAEVDRLRSEIGAEVTRGTEALAATTTALLGEGGDFPAAFDGFREELAGLLDGTFSADSKTSVLAKFDDLLEVHQKKIQAALAAQLDLSEPDSPLARSREAILERVEEEGRRILERIEEMSKDLAVKKARIDESERGTRKGRAFEEIVYAEVQGRSNPIGDIAERVGEEVGAVPGSKVGDVVVDLNPDDVAGRSIRYVLEAKDKNVASLPKMLAELDEALENREAVVAIGVFSSQKNAPTQSPLEAFGSGTKVIVVAEKDEDGDLTQDGQLALRLACAWARLTAIRALRSDEEGDGIDLEIIEEALSRARMALAGAKAIRTAHSRARKGIEEASTHLGSLCNSVEEALETIEAEMRGAGEEA